MYNGVVWPIWIRQAHLNLARNVVGKRLTRRDICVVVAEGDNRLVFLNIFVIVFLRLAIVIVLVTCNVGNAAATTAPTHNLLVDDATYGTISFRGRIVRTGGSGGVEATLVTSPKHGGWFKHRSRRDDGRGGNRHGELKKK